MFIDIKLKWFFVLVSMFAFHQWLHGSSSALFPSFSEDSMRHIHTLPCASYEKIKLNNLYFISLDIIEDQLKQKLPMNWRYLPHI